MNDDYKVLYRKYRPSNFNEVVGQKYTINMLKNAVLNNKLSHAYIFTGPRGTGKTSTAKIFAKTINCESLVDAMPCGECNSCKNINNNADIIEIDAASNNGVDEIRELINNVKVAPSFSKYKVYIIDEVHMLTQSAFNALLLTLEEPPAHIIFILATTNIESVPITILSRCQRYDFKKITEDEIIEHLKYVCEQENISISDDAVREIAYLSDGGLRDALSILNQLSTSTSDISLDVVLENYGSVSLVQIKNIVSSFLSNDYDSLKKIFDDLQKSSIDYKVFIKKMIDELFLESLDRKKGGNNHVYSCLKKIVLDLNELINKININIDPFLLIFMIFVENMQLSNEKVNDNFVKKGENEKDRVEIEIKIENDQNLNENGSNLEKKEVINIVADEMDQFLEKLVPIRVNNCFVGANKVNLERFKKLWGEFLTNDLLDNELKNLIIDCDVVLASDEINILVHNQPSVVKLLNRNLFEVEKKYNKTLNISMKFIVVSLNDWNELKKDYVKKIKEGVKYVFIEEPPYEKKNEDDFLQENDEKLISDDIMNIFDEGKLEIK